MILQHPRPDTSPEAIARRRKANEMALAANIRQGYVIDPRQEADMERVVAGEITTDELREEIIARYRQPQQRDFRDRARICGRLVHGWINMKKCMSTVERSDQKARVEFFDHGDGLYSFEEIQEFTDEIPGHGSYTDWSSTYVSGLYDDVEMVHREARAVIPWLRSL